jgi:hypothetical protein
MSVCDESQLFAPQTNSVPAHMVNAHAYLKQDVFSRLSQASLVQLPQDAEKATGGATPARAPGPLGMRRSRSEASISGINESQLVVANANSSRSSVNSFLQRQNLLEETRRERMERLEAATAPSHRPELCERSLQMASRRRARQAGARVDNCTDAGRLSSGAQRATSAGAVCRATTDRSGGGTHVAAQQSSDERHAKECSFRPKITAAARQMEHRDLGELSAKYTKRREEKLAQLRRAAIAAEQKEVTLKPNINDYNGISSFLRVVDQPDSLLNRMEQRRSYEMKRASEKHKQSVEKETAECTFRPQNVKAAPAFVGRMAETYRMVRDNKEKENQGKDEGNVRPDWK